MQLIYFERKNLLLTFLKRSTVITLGGLLISMLLLTGCVTKSVKTPVVMGEQAQAVLDSPQWVTQLPQAKKANQLLVVAGYEKTTAWVSMHEKDSQGKWHMIMTTPGFIGREGLGKEKEGDFRTPVGTFRFNKAFGGAPDPGCALDYVQVNEDWYWSSDWREGKRYNKMVRIQEIPDLDVSESEHLIDYPVHYKYALSISYNEPGIPGLGNAIFLHCLGPNKPFTAGCVAIPEKQMLFVMQHVKPDCVVVIDSLQNLGGSF